MKKLVLVLLLVANYATMMAQTPKIVTTDKDGWHKIGETIVDFKNETDQIMVLGANRFASIKMKVTEAPILLVSFDVYFENGTHESLQVNQEVKIQGETKSITFDGEKIIKKIGFRYQTVGILKDKKAHVELWGLKTNPDKK